MITTSAQKATYSPFGRIAHGFPHEGTPGPRVMDDFGNSVRANMGMITFHLRGPVPAYQDELPHDGNRYFSALS